MDEKDMQQAVLRLIAAIKGDDEDARWAAADKAAEAGPAAIVPLAEVMAGPDPAAAKAAGVAMGRIVHASGRPGAGGAASQAADELVRLIGPDRPRNVRSEALRYLGFIGGTAQADAIAAQIADTDIREDARMALQRIPGQAAERALQKAKREGPLDYADAIDRSLSDRKTTMREAGIRR